MAGLQPPVPYQWQPGDIGNAALMDAQLYNGLTFMLNPPVAQLYASAVQAIGTSGTVANLDTVVFDPYSGFSASTHAWVAPFSAWWDITGKVYFSANTTGNRAAWINVNGTSAPTTENWTSPTANTVTATADGLVYAAAGQSITLLGWQNTGANLNTAQSGVAFASLRIKFAHL